MFKEFYPINKYVRMLERRQDISPSLREGEYVAVLNGDGLLTLSCGSERAIRYFDRDFKELEKNGEYPVCYIHDYPSFAIRGAVEGYYGKPFTFGQRMDLMQRLKELKMNAYIYAPKDDPYHRNKWREDYPPQLFSDILRLNEEAASQGVDMFFAISPGNDFDFASQSDYELLLNKLKAVKAGGVKYFALLMDDIEPKLSEEAGKGFSSPAHAHAHLANYILKNLEPAYPMLFCPTDYMQNFDTPYRADIRNHLDGQIAVFWTGYNTVAEVITNADGETVMKSFGRRTVLWDNYPVNDFEPKRRVYFGPVANRGRELDKTHIGYIANLSELYESNALPLYTMADYAWDPASYNSELSLERAIKYCFGRDILAGESLVFACYSNVMVQNTQKSDAISCGDWDFLDEFYARQSLGVKGLKQSYPLLAEELEELIEFMLLECELYSCVKRGACECRRVQELAEKMNGLKYAVADCSLLAYANKTFDLSEGNAFKIDAQRIIYRRW